MCRQLTLKEVIQETGLPYERLCVLIDRGIFPQPTKQKNCKIHFKSSDVRHFIKKKLAHHLTNG